MDKAVLKRKLLGQLLTRLGQIRLKYIQDAPKLLKFLKDYFFAIDIIK